MEYLVIVGLVAVLVIPMILIFYTYADKTEDEIITNQLQKIGLRVGDSAEAMYYLGEPSRTRIKAYFPKNIRNVSVGNNEIVFIVNTKSGLDHIVIYTPVPIQGDLDIHAGYHNIHVRSRGNYVEISD
ncbi:hypothetical protein HQ545_05445 [Candidatus Woesearchaeota archaeon]|nr:hypothetical protein [Candidatus Woesearchaeota archaeon]